MGVIQSTITRVQRRNKIAVMRKTISTGKSDVITEIMMPVYYTSEAVSKTNISIIKESWYEIVNSTGEEFQSKKGQIPYSKCLEWFEKLFTERLFDVHPVREFFTNTLNISELIFCYFSCDHWKDVKVSQYSSFSPSLFV